jgi:hypothetical protein
MDWIHLVQNNFTTQEGHGSVRLCGAKFYLDLLLGLCIMIMK